VPYAVCPQQTAQSLQPLKLFAATFAARDMRLDHRDIGGIELIIEQPAKQHFLISAGGHHFTLLEFSSAFRPAGSSSFASIARPRASRDITVPIGTPVTWAISA
jgi:hypothetical protein